MTSTISPSLPKKSGSYNVVILVTAFYFLTSFAVERASFAFFLGENGYSPVQTGALQILFSCSLFALEIPTGMLADRFGRAESLVGGTVLKGLSIAGQFYFVDSGLLTALFFVLSAAGFSLISGSFSALLYDRLKSEGRISAFGNAMAGLQFGGSVSLGLAMVAAGTIMETTGWHGVYLTSSALALLAVAPVLPLLSSTSVGTPSVSTASLFRDFFSELRAIWPKALPFALAHAAMTPYFIYASVSFNSLGMSKSAASSVVGAAEILGALLVVVVIKSMPSIRTKWLPAIIAILAALMAPNVTYGVTTAIVAFVASNFIVLLLEVVASEYMNSQISKDEVRASALSAVSFMDMIFIASGFAVYGLLADKWSPAVAMSALATFPLIGAALMWRALRRAADTV